MDERVKKLKEDASKLFGERGSLHSLWQEMAYQFYVEMADFTINRYLGDEWADHLTTSYPLMARRSLGDSLSALLRPRDLDTVSPGIWFSITTDRADREDNEAKRWLEWATGVQRRAMYDRKASFVRATKEGDHSFVTFGQCPLTLQMNQNRDALLYRCWHLRDVAWTEDSEGQINRVFRRWKPTVTQLTDTFGNKVSSKISERIKNDPYSKVNCLHVVIASDKWTERDPTGKKYRQPWVSLWIDEDNDHVMEEIGSDSRIYIIPRWVTIPGTQYAASPAVTAALPDARLIQSMTLTLLESGEKFADPPIIATQEAIRSDVNVQAGGMTWVDAEYDERLGDVMRPLYEPRAGEGMRVGMEMAAGITDSISKAFFLDSLSLPPAGVKEMTAFEVGQRISEWIRRAMPIFEPVETEYNGALCEDTFELMMRNGAFGPVSDMPQSLKGREIRFKFESPLHESSERRKGQKFLEAKAALAEAAQYDPSVPMIMDFKTTMRDVLDGIGVPAKWTHSERQVAEAEKQQQEQQQQVEMLQGATAGGEIAKNLGAATKDFAAASQV